MVGFEKNRSVAGDVVEAGLLLDLLVAVEINDLQCLSFWQPFASHSSPLNWHSPCKLGCVEAVAGFARERVYVVR